ncbi:hypothetical protein RRG08_017178 [Elysia crispata]|uniref:Uncharacterized protein n=1 Tax=Elysia crispata TaxID=231223 RepID=A0AAE1B246_9GAST|nr:hypothetical protein RRG08_017178 [Elysia crispata]
MAVCSTPGPTWFDIPGLIPTGHGSGTKSTPDYRPGGACAGRNLWCFMEALMDLPLVLSAIASDAAFMYNEVETLALSYLWKDQ